MSVKPPSIKSYSLPGFNLSTGETLEVPLHQVYYGDGRTIFPPGEQRPYVNDSVGGACHRDSPSVIESAWLEFIERQSLIYNWLTQSPGSAIAEEQMAVDTRMMLRRMRGYFEEIPAFDISLHPEVCVAVVMGFGETYMGIGVGAHWSTSAAVRSALRELLAQVMDYRPWPDPENRVQCVDQLDEKIEQREQIDNIYARNYYDNYSPKRLREAFRYLMEGPASRRPETEAEGVEQEDMMSRIERICRSLSVEPIVVRVPACRDDSTTRVMKMTSIGGYPHMRCDVLVPEEHAISFHRGEAVFPNRGLLIPFP
ncbi:MAG: YcaO-like family protein [Sulfobacillus sp.]